MATYKVVEDKVEEEGGVAEGLAGLTYKRWEIGEITTPRTPA
jgi:hypothetical protein